MPTHYNSMLTQVGLCQHATAAHPRRPTLARAYQELRHTHALVRMRPSGSSKSSVSGHVAPKLEWAQISCVSKLWASIFRGECLWQTAIARTWPTATLKKRWPGPIPRGLARRRYMALYVSQQFIAIDNEVDELAGHAYLFLKEQLEHSTMPPTSSILHGTIIDQFISCGRPRDKAHELASHIWLAVINNLEENEHTFTLLKRLALEGDFFLPYPYSRSYKVLWRVFERLFTDFRDCFSHVDFFDMLSSAKTSFQPIPSTWLGH
ncbi:hypothetical protein HPP92_017384 [Vanilla planifolia]|uniref:Uncharacterized protein n=1 Tax=Vanilla planifolia TaxID=51239 RepID=A0A835QJE3_VANPL|nr:hypothetical protein HPP92_017384 [Vanilla planifolia]